MHNGHVDVSTHRNIDMVKTLTNREIIIDTIRKNTFFGLYLFCLSYWSWSPITPRNLIPLFLVVCYLLLVVRVTPVVVQMNGPVHQDTWRELWKGRNMTSRVLWNDLQQSIYMFVSPQTVTDSVRARCSHVGPLLIRIAAQPRWMGRFTIAADVSRFTLATCDGWGRVWRHRAECFSAGCILLW